MGSGEKILLPRLSATSTNLIPRTVEVHPLHDLEEVVIVAAVKSRFTRIPKTYDLIQAGVPTEVIPVYCALSDHANNRTGLCWPRMETLARRLSRSPRTIQRYLHLLKDLGLIEFVKRKRDSQGRFGAYLYKVLHIVSSASSKTRTTGHQQRMAHIKRTKQIKNTPSTSPKRSKRSVTEDYEWLFGDNPPAGTQDKKDRKAEERRRRASERRREGYEWLFK